MITVQIRLHGILRDKLPRAAHGRAELTLQPDATVADVLAHFGIDRLVTIAVNEEVELNETHPLQDGDLVEVFRVAAGG